MSEDRDEDAESIEEWKRNPATQVALLMMKRERHSLFIRLLSTCEASLDAETRAAVTKFKFADKMVVQFGGKKMIEDRSENGET